MATVCETCKAPTRWAQTDSGNWMMIDAEPDRHRGNLRLRERGTIPPRVSWLSVDDASAARRAGESLYISHFANCPQADEHRRRGR
jgi:hypothetical protein